MFMTNKKYSSAFTIVELVVIIVVIGILAGVTIIGYGSWRNQVASTEVKNDLSSAAATMENARNFGEDGYPTDIPSTFTASPNALITYESGDATSFCIDGRSTVSTSIYYFVDSSNGKEVLNGTCAGGEGSTP